MLRSQLKTSVYTIEVLVLMLFQLSVLVIPVTTLSIIVPVLEFKLETLKTGTGTKKFYQALELILEL